MKPLNYINLRKIYPLLQSNSFPFLEKTYDDIDEYAILARLQRALLEIGENNNNLNDNFNELNTTLTDDFNKLKDYVNNYFKNLDVQDEIDNKLQQMANDGTLDEIIDKYITNTILRIYKTVSEMKNDTSLQANMICQTQGFYEMGDNGASYYIILENQTANESDIIALNNGLFAKFIQNTNVINVKQFGCKEDGQTDDSDKLQNLINYAEENNFPMISGNKQNLLITKTIYVPAYANLKNIYFYTNSPASNFLNGFMIYINYDKSSSNWKIAYPNACKGTMENCELTNNNASNIINGIYNYANNNFTNIQTNKLNISFKNAVNYLDSVTLFKVYVAGKTDSDFAIDLGFLGDAVKLENAHLYGSSEGSQPNFIKCGGGHHCIDIKDIILNGAMQIIGDTVNLQNIHGENGQSITIDSATVSVNSLYMIHASLPTFVITNSSVTLKDCIFNYEMAYSSFENADDIDIQIDNKSSLTMENCYKNLRGADISEKILFPAKVSTDTFPVNSNFRNISFRNHNIEQLPNVPSKSVSLAYSGTSEKVKWFTDSNTYYYYVVPVLDFERMLRYGTYYTDKNIQLTKDGQGFRYAQTSSGINCIIYRGLADGNYNKRALIGICNNTIQDNGFMVNGVKWEDYSGDVENFNSWYNDVKYNGKNIITIGSKPTYGNWKKGDIIYNIQAQANNDIGWLCTAAGTPGTWISLGKVPE